MPYVQSHTNLRNHPKTEDLREALAQATGHPIPRYAVVGWLHLLWHWTLEYSPWGDLSRFRPAQLAAAAEYPYDPGPFVVALIDTGWLTRQGEHLTVHDWLDYAGEMLRRRQARAAARATTPTTPPTPATTLPRGKVPPAPAARPTPQEPAGFAGIRALRATAKE